MKITPYTQCESEQVANLYHASVHAISPKLYTPEQLEAWAPTPPDLDFGASVLRTQPLLCWVGGKLTGFIELEEGELEEGGYINCFYTHPEHQRRGVATALYRRIENLAIERAYKTLTVDASKVARSFQRHGLYRNP